VRKHIFASCILALCSSVTAREIFVASILPVPDPSRYSNCRPVSINDTDRVILACNESIFSRFRYILRWNGSYYAETIPPDGWSFKPVGNDRNDNMYGSLENLNPPYDSKAARWNPILGFRLVSVFPGAEAQTGPMSTKGVVTYQSTVGETCDNGYGTIPLAIRAGKSTGRIATEPGCTRTYPSGVNNAGAVAGTQCGPLNCDLATDAVVSTTSGVLNLNRLFGISYISVARDINDSGYVVGDAYGPYLQGTFGWYYDPTTTTLTRFDRFDPQYTKIARNGMAHAQSRYFWLSQQDYFVEDINAVTRWQQSAFEVRAIVQVTDRGHVLVSASEQGSSTPRVAVLVPSQGFEELITDPDRKTLRRDSNTFSALPMSR
jgi:hypothetical protein